ncbi:hypothetical protein SDRG_05162 [Saprolegnia diclina VS20]|uniref:ABC transporter domain-containing protein n=1 Tax=Saprolegnia diclina (strain VS20) TaxID=1156394 RepID=T0QHW6_SAPDV|nr:hypothetical protein SDRG_05162 [Saprolegnia diclina VS20]EQC37564.1 hypothetical protein SDRG_05162 [Saprolegnia diclina VS20]|eukprot:XP_008609084.1 hypothetical protein SDRG_05162 [Saprolegnia diclina VS20]
MLAQTSTLSGCSKRKVCVLLALLGDAKLVLLDEPTSGIDVDSQKHVWPRSKAHWPAAPHRIGIMANGELHCAGTSGALKDKYGVSYKLHVVKAARDASDKVRIALASVPGASVLRDHKSSGVLETYDVATMTLEDVFVKIASGDTAMAPLG